MAKENNLINDDDGHIRFEIWRAEQHEKEHQQMEAECKKHSKMSSCDFCRHDNLPIASDIPF